MDDRSLIYVSYWSAKFGRMIVSRFRKGRQVVRFVRSAECARVIAIY